MSQVEIQSNIQAPAEALTGARRAAVLVGVAAANGFAIGWLLSLLSEQWSNGELSVVGLVFGTLVGAAIGRMGTKETM